MPPDAANHSYVNLIRRLSDALAEWELWADNACEHPDWAFEGAPDHRSLIYEAEQLLGS